LDEDAERAAVKMDRLQAGHVANRLDRALLSKRCRHSCDVLADAAEEVCMSSRVFWAAALVEIRNGGGTR
jgi:hypothetical protein